MKSGRAILPDYHLPSIMLGVPMPDRILSVDIGNRDRTDPKSFGIDSASPCADAAKRMSAGFSGGNVAAISMGTNAYGVGWLVLASSDSGDGVSLTFRDGPQLGGQASCAIEGIASTGVTITATGQIAGSDTTQAFVGCSQDTAGKKFAVFIWDAVVGSARYAILIQGSGAGPGKLSVVTDKNQSGIAPSNAHSLAEFTGSNPTSSGPPPGLIAFSGGTFTVSHGLASGTFDLAMPDGGTVKGTFACGTLPVSS